MVVYAALMGSRDLSLALNLGHSFPLLVTPRQL